MISSNYINEIGYTVDFSGGRGLSNIVFIKVVPVGAIGGQAEAPFIIDLETLPEYHKKTLEGVTAEQVAEVVFQAHGFRWLKGSPLVNEWEKVELFKWFDNVDEDSYHPQVKPWTEYEYLRNCVQGPFMVRHWRNFETAGFKDEVLEHWLHDQIEANNTFSSEKEIRDIIYETGQNDLYEIENLFFENGIDSYYYRLIDCALQEWHSDAVDYDRIAASLWGDYVNEYPQAEEVEE